MFNMRKSIENNTRLVLVAKLDRWRTHLSQQNVVLELCRCLSTAVSNILHLAFIFDLSQLVFVAVDVSPSGLGWHLPSRLVDWVHLGDEDLIERSGVLLFATEVLHPKRGNTDDLMEYVNCTMLIVRLSALWKTRSAVHESGAVCGVGLASRIGIYRDRLFIQHLCSRDWACEHDWMGWLFFAVVFICETGQFCIGEELQQFKVQWGLACEPAPYPAFGMQ